MQAIERHAESLDWASLVFLLALIIISLTKHLYPQRFTDFVSLLTSNKFILFKGKEYKAFHPFNILMLAVNVLSVSLLIYLILKLAWPAESFNTPLILFIRIATAYISFVLLKIGIEKIIANIFNIDEDIDYYIYQKLSHKNYTGLLLLFPLLLYYYSFAAGAAAIYILLGILIFTNLISLALIYRKNQKIISTNWFYFILYLCALEIAPYFILYKLFTI